MANTTTTEIKCELCDADEELGGEITEKALEAQGWSFSDSTILCPEHNEDRCRDCGSAVKGNCFYCKVD